MPELHLVGLLYIIYSVDSLDKMCNPQ